MVGEEESWGLQISLHPPLGPLRAAHSVQSWSEGKRINPNL